VVKKVRLASNGNRKGGMAVGRWKLITSLVITAVILLLAWLNRDFIVDAFGLMREARPGWIALSLLVILLSYLVSAQVFHVVLRSLGYTMNPFRLWATAIVAIVVSQSVPAGGVGSYAFLMSNFTRRGVPSGKAALIASMETLSYACAMLLFFCYSLLYLTFQGLGASVASYLAAGVAVAVIAGAVFVLTRPAQVLHDWILACKHTIARVLFLRRWGDAGVEHLVNDLVRGRALLYSRRRDVALLVLIQLTALSGHSLAMLLLFRGLGVEISFLSVAAAFGIALITSTFNVLPGGGGTVETALVAVLSGMGGGAAALPAAVIFRLLNFWLLTPVAALSYHWLMHEQVAPLDVRQGLSTKLD
jgi:uncharacterized protein (TIRG00374 family)